MSLVADYDSESDSSVSSCENTTDITVEIKTEITSTDQKIPIPSFKLPAPTFRGDLKTGEENLGSVFINPFLEAENAKQAILQKHVKMIDTKDAVLINGKKICWNYRKGRCRFGHNCKYAHDSDLQKTQAQLDEENELSRSSSLICQSEGTISSFALSHLSSEELDSIKEEAQAAMKVDKKRKRPGLTQGLIPGRKVMKQYLHNK